MRILYTCRNSVRIGIFLIVLGATVCSLSCHRPHSSLVIEPGNPLRFVVSGRGTLTGLRVSGPDLERESNRHGEGDRLTALKVYWELASQEGQEHTLDEIGEITYGKVPQGFAQIEPQSGNAPPPLVKRDLYNIKFSMKNDDGINRFFTLQDGRVVAEGER